MCGRTSFSKNSVPKTHRYEARLEGVKHEPNFDGRPSQFFPIFLPDTEKAEMAIWTLPDKWIDGTPTLPFNIRLEGLMHVPRFRELLAKNRCIIPIDGFYEWKDIEPEPEPETPYQASEDINLDMFGNPILTAEDKKRIKTEKKVKPKKQRHRITLKNKEPFGLAGLWREKADSETGELIKYFGIITTKPNSAVAPYHHRMPIILTQQTEEIWLDNKKRENQHYNVFTQYDSKKMKVMAVDEVECLRGNFIEPKSKTN